MRRASISSLEDEGPSVATILVLRIVKGHLGRLRIELVN